MSQGRSEDSQRCWRACSAASALCAANSKVRYCHQTETITATRATIPLKRWSLHNADIPVSAVDSEPVAPVEVTDRSQAFLAIVEAFSMGAKINWFWRGGVGRCRYQLTGLRYSAGMNCTFLAVSGSLVPDGGNALVGIDSI